MGIKNVILDMDGVIQIGRTAIPGAVETISVLKEKGVRVFFLTNNGMHTREHFVKNIRNYGIEVREEEVYCTSYGAGRYIKTKLPGKRVFTFSQGMQDELIKHGIELDFTSDAQVVVAGLDLDITYEKLTAAFRAIMEGAAFLASNDDVSFPVEGGLMPGAGAFVAALERSTGKKAIVLGKPEPFLLDLILKEHGLEKDETLMVGDKLETDILMAKQEGMKSVMVLTGVSDKKEIEKTGLEPDLVLESIVELPGKLRLL